jgi:sec-independent protein translocase protein TatA
MPSIGPLELIIVLVIILVIFGPKRLPQAGKALGQGLREFKDSVTGKDKDKDKDPPIVQASSELPAGEPAEPRPEEPAAAGSDASQAFGRKD